jgi:ferredoxin
MQFINKQNNLALSFDDFIQDRLQPVFKFSPEFRARDQGAEIKGNEDEVREAAAECPDEAIKIEE